jgi:hypothetical protein
MEVCVVCVLSSIDNKMMISQNLCTTVDRNSVPIEELIYKSRICVTKDHHEFRYEEIVVKGE